MTLLRYNLAVEYDYSVKIGFGLKRPSLAVTELCILIRRLL